jgi:pimeloyl-ACP methyl ester carboxylesterase
MTLLFVHGLGDSGLTFERIFDDRRFDEFNLLIPDLAGCGRSSAVTGRGGYAFETHIKRLWDLIGTHELKSVILIGHSMGGDITTLMCQSDMEKIIQKYVNIEGDVTQHDLFISGKAALAAGENRFDEWFRYFVDNTVFGNYGRHQSGRDYYASIRFCRPRAFLENALEIVRRNTVLSGEYKSQIGNIYCNLSIPRVFCYGTQSLARESLNFLIEREQRIQAFEHAGHCPQTDKAEEFRTFLLEFISEEV